MASKSKTPIIIAVIVVVLIVGGLIAFFALRGKDDNTNNSTNNMNNSASTEKSSSLTVDKIIKMYDDAGMAVADKTTVDTAKVYAFDGASVKIDGMPVEIYVYSNDNDQVKGGDVIQNDDSTRVSTAQNGMIVIHFDDMMKMDKVRTVFADGTME